MNNLASALNKAMVSIRSDTDRRTLIKKEIEKYLQENDTPMLLYKTYSDFIRYTNLLDLEVYYQKPHKTEGVYLGETKKHVTYHKAGLCLRSTVYSFGDRHTPRVATKELKDQINAIDKQIKELEKKRYRLLEENWSKCKKLGIQTAQDYAEIRKNIIEKFKEI